LLAAALLLAVAAACDGAAPTTAEGPTTTPVPATTTEAGTTTTTTVPPSEGVGRILLVGDVMLGRGVAPIVAGDPDGVFEHVRHSIAQADVAAANLESPLTTRPHVSENPNALEADPAAASLLAAAGFDVVSVANNHAGDAGPESVTDTIEAADSAGILTVGGGWDATAAGAPVIVDVDGLTIAFLAFDATQQGLAATATSAGIARYQGTEAEERIADARASADVVIVSVHGGIEYLPESDPAMERIAADLSAWGADVVWGHGSHVAQPVSVLPGQRPVVVATSLGNFLFDQEREITETGAVLEVLVDRDGVIAYRTGTSRHPQQRAEPITWDLPPGDAALLDLEWWQLTREVPAQAPQASADLLDRFDGGDVTAASTGDVTGNDSEELVVSFRRPFQANPVNSAFPDRDWRDEEGRSAHLGAYVADDLSPVWVAGTLFRPIATLAACDGSVALAFDDLDDPTVVATGAWVWQSFGFTIPVELPGSGTPACGDVDHDGLADPVILHR